MNLTKIFTEKPSKEKLEMLNTKSWATWTCDVSTFDWYYSEEEMCYFYEGKVIVETEHEKLEINPGDFVVFPKGLKCTWNVLEPVKKAYKFK
jgi:uncharacterized protein